MHAGQARPQLLQPGVVVDRVEETGDQVQRLIRLEARHVLPAELCLGAAQPDDIQHWLIDIQWMSVLCISLMAGFGFATVSRSRSWFWIKQRLRVLRPLLPQ
ncbi:hypothetical protein D3C78_1713580 [compost metagenome]